MQTRFRQNQKISRITNFIVDRGAKRTLTMRGMNTL